MPTPDRVTIPPARESMILRDFQIDADDDAINVAHARRRGDRFRAYVWS
jgi:hypothetical protein